MQKMKCWPVLKQDPRKTKTDFIFLIYAPKYIKNKTKNFFNRHLSKLYH